MPFILLLIITEIISTKGKNKIKLLNKGSHKLTWSKVELEKLKVKDNDVIAKIDPKKYEPASPIYNSDGYLLKIKNPISAPVKGNIINNIQLVTSDWVKENKVNKKIIPIPEANPSKPSIQLIALVDPTNQKIVIR